MCLHFLNNVTPVMLKTLWDLSEQENIRSVANLHSQVCRCEVVLFADWLSGQPAAAPCGQIGAEEGRRHVVRGVSSHRDILPER